MEIESTLGSIWETESTHGLTCEAPSAITEPQFSNIEEEERICESQRNVILMTRPCVSSRKRLSKEQTNHLTTVSLRLKKENLRLNKKNWLLKKGKLATLKCISSSLEQCLHQATPSNRNFQATPSNRNFPWGSADDTQYERHVTL